MDYRELCMKTIAIARKAGNFIVGEMQHLQKKDIITKGLHDFVTDIDRRSEQMIIDDLLGLLPDSTFLAEEETKPQQWSDLMWIIDPLDGTTNFIHGIPLFSVSIALLHNNTIVLGVIYEPNSEECFYAWKNGGSWMNNRAIKVSETVELKNSLLATGFPYYDFKHLDGYMEFLKMTILETRGIRRLGSAAVDMAWVACGRFEGFYEYGLRPWDVAAGVCIVREAGGIVTDFQGGEDFFSKKELIAANSPIHDRLIQDIGKFLKI